MIEYGLIGSNVANSFSKLIHEGYANINYELVSLNDENKVKDFLKAPFKGINVTIPYKKVAFELCDVVSEEAKSTNVVNTIVKREGKTYGFNTDIYGFEKLLEKNNIVIKNKKCLILGTGSTSRTVTYVLNRNKCKSIIYLSRTPNNINVFAYSDIENYKDAEIIINTTPVGMNDEESLLDFSIFTNAQYFVDVIYNKAHTKMAINALENNIKTVNGLYMLIAQAHKSQELFFNKPIDERIIEKAYLKLFFNMFNLTFIGHPLSGKTELAKELSRALDVKTIDIDQEIEKREQRTISAIFKENGENYFRKIESSLLKEVSGFKGYIISLGGGAVLNKENMELILKNSLVVSLKRNISDIKDNEFINRPLCTCKSQLLELISVRALLYKKYSDLEIENDSFEKSIKKIGEILWNSM